MNTAVVRKCKCRSEFQDKTYGPGNRVYNVSTDGKVERCTVCNSTSSGSKPDKKQ